MDKEISGTGKGEQTKFRTGSGQGMKIGCFSFAYTHIAVTNYSVGRNVCYSSQNDFLACDTLQLPSSGGLDRLAWLLNRSLADRLLALGRHLLRLALDSPVPE